MAEDLWSKDYFDDRANRDMAKHLASPRRTMKEALACACRILAIGVLSASADTKSPLV